MDTIKIARRLAELGQTADAQRAYTLALQAAGLSPEEELEAASYLLFSKGDYRVAYTSFLSLYRRGLFQKELLELMTQAFYLPNVEALRRQYEENCTLLSRYPYLFRRDFLPFEDLPIQFYPYDDDGYLPFDWKSGLFSDYVNFHTPVIDRNFFHDLEKPVLASDVYSQYQLEYLNDTVRKSEWVGRENHIYLHYTDWGTFCAHLQCLSFKKLLKEEKLVFLIEDELAQYPIDFQARFHIDYSRYPVRPVGIREVNRLIWHTQLAAHNGGDFFNEIFYGHPNLLAYESVILDGIDNLLDEMRRRVRERRLETATDRQLLQIKHPTDKDLLVAYFLNQQESNSSLDPDSRITPILFFQPHFYNISYDISVDTKSNKTVLHSEQYDRIRSSAVFQNFKYIKTFTPIRRPTTSYAATIRFMEPQIEKEGRIVADDLTARMLNRSFMVDPWDRLYRDSVLVRFEDGKLNPKATFTALAEFLDLPYTQSMTYCSGASGIDPESLAGNARGFDPATVYRTYDEFANDDERAFLEYFLRDVYETYGYDFHYYKGEPVDEEWVTKKISRFTTLNRFISRSWESLYRNTHNQKTGAPLDQEEIERRIQDTLSGLDSNRMHVSKLLMRGLRFINEDGQPLKMMTPLKLDPALLEQPLYH